MRRVRRLRPQQVSDLKTGGQEARVRGSPIAAFRFHFSSRTEPFPREIE